MVDRPQLQAVVQVGRRAQMLIDHPGWQTYLDHLEAIRTQTMTEREAVAKEIAEGDSLGEALAQLKLRIRLLDGQLKGLGLAIDLVPAMMQRAQKAAELLGATSQDSPPAGPTP